MSLYRRYREILLLRLQIAELETEAARHRFLTLALDEKSRST